MLLLSQINVYEHLFMAILLFIVLYSEINNQILIFNSKTVICITTVLQESINRILLEYLYYFVLQERTKRNLLPK